MRELPDTTKPKAGGRPVVGAVPAAAGLGVVLLAAILSLWPTGFSPGEDLVSPAARDIAVSTQDTTYPDSDALRIDGRPGMVYVYLRVEDLTAPGDFEAKVFRTARSSVINRLANDGGLRVVEGGGEPLGLTGDGVSGVLKVAVRPVSGRRLPAGNYTVEVYSAIGGAGSGGVLARKYFVVGD